MDQLHLSPMEPLFMSTKDHEEFTLVPRPVEGAVVDVEALMGEHVAVCTQEEKVGVGVVTAGCHRNHMMSGETMEEPAGGTPAILLPGFPFKSKPTCYLMTSVTGQCIPPVKPTE